MLIPVQNNKNVYEFDGVNMRDSVLSEEINVASVKSHKELDKYRCRIKLTVYDMFKKVIDGQTEKANLIEKLARTQKKFDVMSGLGITSGNIYSFLLDKSLSHRELGLDTEEYANISKRAADMPNLYRTFINFSNQLFDSSVVDMSTQINVDSTITDSEGKQLNIVSSLAEEDTDTDVSDQTLRLNYKAYLNFLFNAVTSLKGVRRAESYLNSAVPLLTLLWVRDSIRAVQEEAGDYSSKLRYAKFVGLDESKSAISIPLKLTPPVLILPVRNRTYSPTAGKNVIRCSVDKQTRICNSISFPLDEKTIGYLQTACEKSYIQYKGDMEVNNDKINEDPFVFARYIFRLLKMVGVKLIDREYPNGMTETDIYNVLLNPDNPKSLVSLIPAYKFSPDFFLKTKSIEEWFTSSVSGCKDEYDLEVYSGFSNTINAKISQPTVSILNTSTRNQYPLSAQTKVGVFLDEDQEINQVLQLEHINKLCGTGGTFSDCYANIIKSKKERIYLFEQPITYSATSGSKVASGVSSRIKAETENPENAKYYKAKGLHVHEYLYEGIVNYTVKSNSQTDEQTRAYMDTLINAQIDTLVDDYMKFYQDMHWYFPFMETREHLLNMILGTKRGDAGYMFLLGDCIYLNADREVHFGQDDYKELLCAVTSNYKLIHDNVMYTPSLATKEQIISESEYRRRGEPDGAEKVPGGYKVQVQMLLISDK